MTLFEPAPPPPPIRAGSIRARALALIDVPIGLEGRMVDIIEGCGGRVSTAPGGRLTIGSRHAAPPYGSPTRASGVPPPPFGSLAWGVARTARGSAKNQRFPTLGNPVSISAMEM